MNEQKMNLHLTLTVCKKRFGKPDRELAGMGIVINLKYVC